MSNYQNSNNKHQTLVFFTGWGFKATIWQSCKMELSSYEIIDIDLPYLKSLEAMDKPHHEIVELLAKKIPSQSIFIAWSIGGLLALELCQQYPEKCSKLFMIATTPKFVATDNWHGISHETAEEFKLAADHQLSQLLTKFYKISLYPNLRFRSSIQNHQFDTCTSTLQFYLHYLLQADLRHLHGQLAIAPIYILGAKDAIIPICMTTDLINNNKKTVIHIIPNAGHIPFLSHFDEFMKILKNNLL